MLAAMRQAEILEQVKQAGGARVSDLSQMLGVSDMTIRRDLEALAQQGLVSKVHGGASFKSPSTFATASRSSRQEEHSSR